MLNLGDIRFGLGANTRGLYDAANQMTAFQRQVNQVQNSVTSANQAIATAANRIAAAQERVAATVGQVHNRAARAALANAQAQRGAATTIAAAERNVVTQLFRQEQAAFRAMEAVKQLNFQLSQSKLAPDTAQALSQRAVNAGTALSNAMTANREGGSLSNVDFQRLQRDFNSSMAAIRRDMVSAKGALIPPDAAGWLRFSNSLRGAGQAALFASGHFGGLSTRMFALTQLISEFGPTIGLAAGAITGLGAAVAGLGTSMVRNAIQIQSVQTSLTAVTGNAAAAAIELDFVRRTAVQAGVDFQGTAKSYGRLLASATAAGLAQSQIRDIFVQTSMAASTLQLDINDVQGVFRALEQMLSKGTVQAEEIRGQLGDRIPAAFSMAARAMGVTERELNKLLKAGKVMSSVFVPKFAEEMSRSLGIDLTSSIDNLRASITNMGTQWQFFNIAMDNATGLSKAFKAAIEGATSVLAYMADNTQTLIAILGAASGALVGFAIAAAAPAIVGGAIAVGQWVVAFTSLAATVRTATQALTLLNIAFMATPAGWIALILRVGVAAAGAVTGFKLMESWVNKNNQALANDEGIKQYIQSQKTLLTATQDTTRAMIEQTAVANKQMQQQSAKLSSDIEAQRSIVRSLTTEIEGMSKGGGRGSQELFAGASVQLEQARTKLMSMNAEANSLAKSMASSTAIVKDLSSTLDAQNKKYPNGIPILDTNEEEAEKAKSDGLTRIRDLIAGAEEARQKMDALLKGPGEAKLVDDLFTAKDALRELDASQLQKVAQMLGTSVVGVEAKLTGMVTAAREAQEQFRQFNRVWDEIVRGEIAIDNIQKRLDALAGGLDPNKLFQFDAMEQAEDLLRRMSDDSLAKLSVRLKQIYPDATSAAEGLGRLFAQEERGRRLVDIMSTLADETRRNMDEVSDLKTLQEAYSKNSFVGDEVAQLVERNAKVRDYVRVLESLGATQDQINEATSAFANSLAQVDGESRVFERLKTIADQSRDAWLRFTDDALEGLKGLVNGTQSLGDYLKNILTSLSGSLMDNFVINPAKNAIQMGLENLAAARVAGNQNNTPEGSAGRALDGLTRATELTSAALGHSFIGSIAQSILGMGSKVSADVLATAAMTNLATAATAAAMSLNSMAMGNGGGFFSSLLQGMAKGAAGGLGVTKVGGGVSFGADYTAPLGNFGFQELPAMTMPVLGRATGGPITKGQAYRVNEPGTYGDTFIAGASGWAYPNRGGGGGNSTFIDASTTIDARGATQETLNDIRREMQAREARIRKMIPYQIDQRQVENRQRNRSR